MIQKKVKGVNYPARQQRDCFLQKPRRTYKEMDWSTFRRLRNVRSEKANYNRNLIQENIDDSKSFWTAVKRILPNDKKLKQSVFSIKIDGNLKTDKNAIAKCFNHFFASIVKTINDKLSQRSSAVTFAK